VQSMLYDCIRFRLFLNSVCGGLEVIETHAFNNPDKISIKSLEEVTEMHLDKLNNRLILCSHINGLAELNLNSGNQLSKFKCELMNDVKCLVHDTDVGYLYIAT